MKYGVNTLLWTGRFDASHLPLLPQVKAMGFDGIEIARFDFADFPAAGVRQALDACGLECTACSALTGQMALFHDGAPQALEFLRDAIRWAAGFGAKVLVGPFCSAVGYLPGRRRTSGEWARTIEALRSLTPLLDDTGVTLAVEPLNRFETFFLNTAADVRLLCDAVDHPRVGVLFDTFHANIEEKNVRAALAELGPHLKHVHACENDRGAPGSGHVAWQEVFAGLRERDYDGWLVIESFGARIPDIAAAACIWRDLAESSEALAAEGLRFLKHGANS